MEELKRLREVGVKDGYVFDYEQIKQVYNVSMLDMHLGSTEAYLLKKKQDAKATITHIFKRKFEEKLIFQQMNDTRTLTRERVKLEEKLRMISVAVEMAKQRLQWLVYDTPFSISQLEEEVKHERQGHVTRREEDVQLKQMALTYKVDKDMYTEMQRKSREARNMLRIQMLEARALKNRTGCETIGDLVLLYREF